MFESSRRAVKRKNSFCGHLLLAGWLADGSSAVGRVEKSFGMFARSLRFCSAARRQANVGAYSAMTSGVKLDLFAHKIISPHCSFLIYDLTNTFLRIRDKSVRSTCNCKLTHASVTLSFILADAQRKFTSVRSYRFCCRSTINTAAIELRFSEIRER